MGGGETRRTDKSILVRCTTEQYETLKRAIQASLGTAPTYATATVPKFVLAAALEKASALLSKETAPRSKGRGR